MREAGRPATPTCCRPGRRKSFIFCSPIHGQNGVIGGAGLSREIFWIQFMLRSPEMAFYESRPINWIILSKSRDSREFILDLQLPMLPMPIHSTCAQDRFFR